MSGINHHSNMAALESPKLAVAKVKSFIKIIHQYFQNCDATKIATYLRNAEVIDAGQLARINQAPDFLAANRYLYEFLDQDPSSRKLWFLGKALRDDTTKEGHQDLADEIDKFFVQNGCQSPTAHQAPQRGVPTVQQAPQRGVPTVQQAPQREVPTVQQAPQRGAQRLQNDILNVQLSVVDMDVFQKTIVEEDPGCWKNLATAMFFTKEQIKNIEGIEKNKMRMHEVLHRWLERKDGTGDRERTIGGLTAILTACNCDAQADVLDELKKKHSTPIDIRTIPLTEEDMGLLQTGIVDEVPGKWKEMATALGFTINAMQNIEDDYNRNSKRCIQVFERWLKQKNESGKGERTFGVLFDMLYDRDCKIEADKLKKTFKAKYNIP